MKKSMLITIIICFLLIGCNENIPDVDEREIINFKITWKAYSGRGETVQGIVKQFNATQDQYIIQTVSGNESLDDIETSLESNDSDVYVLPYRYVSYLGKNGALKPLDTDLSNHSIEEGLIELCRYNDELYGLPWVCHSMALIYNRTILEELDIDPDKIVDRKTFESVLIEISENSDIAPIGLVGGEHHDLSWMVNQFIYGQGGSLIDSGQVSINSDASYQALDYYFNTLSQYAQASWRDDSGVEVIEAFRQQEIAFEIQSLWGITDIWKNGNTFEVDTIPLSTIGVSSEVGPMMLCVDADISEEKEVIVNDFIEYMISKEAQIDIMHGEYMPEHDRYYPFRLPVRHDILNSEAFEPYVEFTTFIEAYSNASIDVPSAMWIQVKEDLYIPYLHQVAIGEMSIEDFLETIEVEGNKLLEVQ